MDIIKAINDKKLFKPVFKNLDSWQSWLTLLSVFFAIGTYKPDMELFKECTGRATLPTKPFKELWCVIGRRGGKSFMAAVIAVFLALFHKYQDYLAPGERGIIQIIAADRSQAQVILRYIKGVLNSNPIFQQYVTAEHKERIDLSNGISIEVMSCSFRSIRGRSLVCAIFDEIAFWQSDGANPDREIISAVRPGMATIPDSKLIVISSPYSRTGVLYEHHRDYFGKHDPDILVWQAPTRLMNHTIDQGLIDREMQKDKSAATAEWLALFRDDVETFLNPETVRGAVMPGRSTLPAQQHISYNAFTDPSGGRNDSFTLAIAHLENGTHVIDFLRGWKPPFNPETVVNEIASILTDYRLIHVTGDRYGAAFVQSAFEKAGITYEPSELPKSDLYLNFESMLNTGKVELPDNTLLINELCSLERRRGRSGRDAVDHPLRGSDDLANSCAGSCYMNFKRSKLLFPELLTRNFQGRWGMGGPGA